MAATTMYAAVWPVALSLPRNSEGEPMAGINLIGVTTAFYVLVVIIAVVHALNSRLEKRSRAQVPPDA
jgi:hypothetical protein